MTLSGRIALITVGVTLCLVLLGAVSLWGLCGLGESLRAADARRQKLHLVREVCFHARISKTLLQSRGENAQAALDAIDRAIESIDRFTAFPRTLPDPDPTRDLRELEMARRSRRHLADVGQALRADPGARPEGAGPGPLARIDEVLDGFGALAGQMEDAVDRARMESAARLHRAWVPVAAVVAGAVALVTLTSLWQYRGVMVPLRQLQKGVRRLVEGKPREPIQLSGPPEFAGLAADFNRMAGQLETLRADLERKVVVRSRELVRSERLISVGFLAAGVAHEINNPLNIITGYAELSLRLADFLPQSRAATDMKQAFQIIREEGFRCKSITEKLVALARANRRCRETVSVARIVPGVVALVQSLDQFRDASVRMEFPAGDPLTVSGNENELRQVVFNLLINALQSVPPGAGEVIVRGARLPDVIELSVLDNGRGMTPEVLEHVFEPFFCERRPDGERGIGLGLSITHAIVEAHGGKMSAESKGPGQGSKFTIHFPLQSRIQTPGEKAA